MTTCNFSSAFNVIAHGRSPYRSTGTYKVELGKVTGTVTVTANVITDTTATLEKFLGAQLPRFKTWVERKGGMCVKISAGEW